MLCSAQIVFPYESCSIATGTAKPETGIAVKRRRKPKCRPNKTSKLLIVPDVSANCTAQRKFRRARSGTERKHGERASSCVAAATVVTPAASNASKSTCLSRRSQIGMLQAAVLGAGSTTVSQMVLIAHVLQCCRQCRRRQGEK
jgi:hypothetical protein